MTSIASNTTQLFIGGTWREARGGSYDNLNPATGASLGAVGEASQQDVDDAVAAARKAFDGKWPTTPASRRAKIIYKIAQLIGERSKELALLEVRDNARLFRPLTASSARSWIASNFYAGAATKNYGESMPPPLAAYLATTVQEPVGVVGAIVPWNFPLLLAAWKVAPALAAGCTVVLKPAPFTPLSALELAKIALEAGLPEGVLNVVTGSGRETGAWLVAHPDVDKIAFTGSTQTGKLVAARAAETVKRVTLELGGKSPSVVFDDADIDAAVAGALYGIYSNAGQTCEARSRVLLHEAIYDRFVASFVEKARTLRVGNPEDPATHVGAITSGEQHRKIASYCDIARDEGAGLLIGGGVPDLDETNAGGNFWSPSAYEAQPGHRVAREEIFGPVAVFVKFKDEREAVALANDSDFGLSASVWSRDIGRANRVARAIRSGTVAINTPYAVFPGVPFGGYKQSGYGRELGMETMRLYSETKSVLHTSVRNR